MLMDRHSPYGKLSRTIILLGHMSRIRRMVLVSLYGVSDLFNIMPDYPDGVWLQEMMQLMLSNDTDSDDGAHDLIMR
jgi:hypothetical protein